MKRTDILHQIRPTISVANTEDTGHAEKFQNEVLRPILKFQHDLLCFTFLKHKSILKQNFSQKHDDQKKKIIIDVMKNNQDLKSQMVHSITSLMTVEELDQYYIHRSEYKKRIISMASKRLLDTLV